MKIDDIDRIVLLTCAKHEYRMESVLRECSRMGLCGERLVVSSDGISGQHNVATQFEKCLSDGCERVLVLENDVRFLKDAEAARRIIESAPCAQCDGIYFDIFPQWNDARLAHVLGRRRDGVAFMQMLPCTYGASCWLANRKCMEEFVSTFEKNIDHPPDSMTFTMNPRLENCFSLNPPCIQVLYGDAGNMRWENCQHVCYKRWGVDYGLYNVEDGFEYGIVLECGGSR